MMITTMLCATVMMLAAVVPPSQSIEDVEWRAVRIGEEAVVGDAPSGEPTLTLGSSENTASGTGGCNRFTGGYTLEGNELTFSPLATTRMACPEGMDTEDAFYWALDQTRTFAVVDGHLELYDESGELLARMERSE